MEFLRLTIAFSPFSEKLFGLRSWISLATWHLLPVVESWINDFLVLRFQLTDIFFVIGYFWLELFYVGIEEIFLLWSHTVFLEKVVELTIDSIVPVLIGCICWVLCWLGVLCWFVLTIRSSELVIGWVFGEGFKQVFHAVFLVKVFSALLFCLFKFKGKSWKGFGLTLL